MVIIAARRISVIPHLPISMKTIYKLSSAVIRDLEHAGHDSYLESSLSLVTRELGQPIGPRPM